MSKHLNNKEITKYRQSLLPPSELLTVDSHLADCAHCRLRIRQNKDLTMLYESFFEPREEVAANGSKDTDAGLRRKWNLPKKFRFFSVAALLINRQPQVALSLAAIVLIGGLWIFWQKNAPPANEFSEKNNREEKSLLGNSANQPDSIAENEKKNEADQNIKANTNFDNPDLQGIESAKNQTLAAKTIVSKKPDVKIEISELEPDNSRTLSAGSVSNKDGNSAPSLKIGKRKDNLTLDFSSVEDAVEYEIYLAQMPKFVTVSRDKVKNKKWLIPYRKLKAGQSYILQITAFKDGQSIQSVKKIITLKAHK